jgi:hypothetical protein
VTDSGAIPKKPEPNWIKHNNFRSGDISPNVGLAAPDLQMITPESCLSECTGADEATVWVQLGNVGAAPLRRRCRERGRLHAAVLRALTPPAGGQAPA